MLISLKTIETRIIQRSYYLQIFSALLIVFSGAISINAQNTFNSGSTGADGGLSPTSNQTIQVPESGVLNYTTVNIPSGVTVKFIPNSKNTPVTILASGSVTIAGTIGVEGQIGTANGFGGQGGPGGFRGGAGGINSDSFSGTTGDGRGGGSAGRNTNGNNWGGGGGGGHAVNGSNAAYYGDPSVLAGAGGPRYGTTSLLPLVGGSGGGGGAATSSAKGGAGGGGGGAILIACSETITLSGTINARGGNGASIYAGAAGGAGAGGAIRLIANTLTGAGTLDVRGGDAGTIWYYGAPGGNGGNGYIRVEAYNQDAFNPNTNSIALSAALPNPITNPSNPQLRIASIGGVSAPASPIGSFQGVPDVVLPGNLTNPVTVAIEASNVPVGTVVQVSLTPPNGARTTIQSSPLAGTNAASTASASITLPAGMSIITVSLSINLTTASAPPMFINGERIKSIEVAANFGDKSKVVYITQSGNRLSLPESVR